MLIQDAPTTLYTCTNGGFYAGRTFRYASVGGQIEVPSEVVRTIKRTYSESAVKDPLKRFEYLRNGKATSVMIRATPNAVRWDEINRVQYRFQALNFHSDVLEALIHNSPPLSRREHNVASTKHKKLNETLNDANNNNVKPRDPLRHLRDANNNGSFSSDDDDDDVNIEKKLGSRSGGLGSPLLRREVKAVRRTNSCDIKHDIERKGSVVQVGPKDDTSDYNSDEDVFPSHRSVGVGGESGSSDFGSVDYNTTICHVKTGQIKDTTQIRVTSYNNSTDEESSSSTAITDDVNEHKLSKGDLELLANRHTYNNAPVGGSKASSAPPSTKVSTVSPVSDHFSINERFRSEMHNLDLTDGADLSSKSKEELVELVRSLQKELETTKHQSYQRTHSPPLLSESNSRHSSSRRCCSRQDSINEEAFEEESTVPLPSVSSLIQNFEQRNDDDVGGLRRCNTLPYRLRKPPS